MEKRKKDKINLSILVSIPQYTWPLSRCIQKLRTLALIGVEKSATENLIGKKEKWTNKGNDIQEGFIL